MPLDLHVLGLSLAFILSQDQTLRCKYIFFLFFVPLNGSGTSCMFFTYALLFLPCFGCLLFPVCQRSRFSTLSVFSERDCKDKELFSIRKIFKQKFSNFFQPRLCECRSFRKAGAKIVQFVNKTKKTQFFFKKSCEKGGKLA